MKWLTKIIILVMVFSMAKISVLASEANISFTVDGRIANENIVTLNLITNEIKDLYAGSFSISFNKEQVEVIALEGADLLEDSSVQEVKCIVNTKTNSIAYAFTELANGSGIEGEGNLLKIKLRLKDSKINKEIFEEIQVKLIEDSSKQLNYFDLKIDKNLKESSNSSITKPGNSQTNTNGTSNPGNSETNTNGTTKPGNSETETNGTNKPGNSETNTNGTTKPGNSETDTNKSEDSETNNNSEYENIDNSEDSNQIIEDEDISDGNEESSVIKGEENTDSNNSTNLIEKNSVENKSGEIALFVTVAVLIILALIILVIYIHKKIFAIKK